jgi:choline dehydrogenase-like flavoprotein
VPRWREPAALGIPVGEDWNGSPYADGTGWLPIGYTPRTGVRSSSSVAYLHPVMDDRANLTVLTGTRVMRVMVSEGAATGVLVRHADGSLEELGARAEVVLCGGAIDTPRLRLLSGIGPAEQLRSHGLYHVSCTCRMGAPDDPLAVLDPALRVREIRRLSVADASRSRR